MSPKLSLLIKNDFFLDSTDIKAGIMEMAKTVKSMQIETQDACDLAMSDWEKVKDFKKEIDRRRLEKTKPDRDRISMINDTVKAVTEPLQEIELELKHKVGQFQRLQEKLKEEEIAKALEADPTAYVAATPSVIRSEGVSAYSKDVNKFTVVDISKVPLQYMKLDEEKVELAMKMGLTEIPGLNIFTEKQTILRSR